MAARRVCVPLSADQDIAHGNICVFAASGMFHICGEYFNPFRPGRLSFELELEPLFLSFNCGKIADIQAHSAAPSAALRACRSAIFERNRENVSKPLDILTPFYECLLNARSAIFEKS